MTDVGYFPLIGLCHSSLHIITYIIYYVPDNPKVLVLFI